MPRGRLAAAVVLLLVGTGPRLAGAQSTVDAARPEQGLLAAGTIFQPPSDGEIDFGDDAPEPRKPVDKDTRVVAVIFSVNQMRAMRKAFPDAENIDLMPLAGQPMIQHVINGLRNSRYVDRIIVVADPVVRDALPFDTDSTLTFIEDRGDAAENVQHGIHEIARGDLVVLLPSDLALLSGDALDRLVEHARRFEDIDVFFPLIQRERCSDPVTGKHRFIPFKEGRFTGAHVELVRPALFVDNASDVGAEKNTMYEVYHMRRNTLGIVRFLGLRLTLKFIVRDLSPADVATRIYARYHVRAQAFVVDDPRLAADVSGPELVPLFEAALTAEPGATVAAGEAALARPQADPT